jgi:hypothetical protein
VTGIAAGTGVHRADQHEPRGKRRRPRGPRDSDDPFLQRLTEDFEDVSAEFGHLVEEQHAVVGEADLARPRQRPAADQGDIRHGVVRRAERPRRDETAARGEQSRNRMDRRDLERLVERQRRQNPRDALGHHRLAGAGRADEQCVVAAARGDFERAPGQQLSMDVGEVDADRFRAAGGRGRVGRTVAAEAGGIVQRGDGIPERADGVQLDARDHRRFAAIAARKEQGPVAFAPRRGGDRQHAARRLDPAVQRQRADEQHVGNLPPPDDAGGGEHTQRDRQVERRALLAHVGRREIDGDAVRRELESGIANRAADPVAALADAGVGQADHREAGQSVGDVDFDVNRAGLDAVDGSGPDAREHASGLCKSEVLAEILRNYEISATSTRHLPRGCRWKYAEPALASGPTGI